MMTLLTRDQLAALPQVFVVDAAAGLDLSTNAGRCAARLRVACHLSRKLKAATLVKACRANGLWHVCTGPAAAYALARIAFPEPSSMDGGR